MHLFTGTTLFDGSARQCLDECQIALIGRCAMLICLVGLTSSAFSIRAKRSTCQMRGLPFALSMVLSLET